MPATSRARILVRLDLFGRRNRLLETNLVRLGTCNLHINVQLDVQVLIAVREAVEDHIDLITLDYVLFRKGAQSNW